VVNHQAGQPFGDYFLEARLGSGGMGTVYRAHQLHLKRAVALKVLHSAAPTDDEVRRFERESKIHAGLSHPNLVHVYDAGLVDGVAFIAMELVPGSNLQQQIDRNAPLPAPQALKVTREVLEALDHLHQKKLIHRDVKPANVLMTDLGVAKLADFGLCWQEQSTRFTQPGALAGTVAYMAPELFDRGVPAPAADVYAVGIVLYQCLSGQYPFKGGSEGEFLRQISSGNVIPLSRIVPHIHPQLERFVMELLARSPVDRPDARTALTEIDRLLELPDLVCSLRSGYHILSFRWRGFLAVLLVAALAGIGFRIRLPLPGSHDAAPERLRAEMNRAVELRSQLFLVWKKRQVVTSAFCDRYLEDIQTINDHLRQYCENPDGTLRDCSRARDSLLQARALCWQGMVVVMRQWVRALTTPDPRISRVDNLWAHPIALDGEGRQHFERTVRTLLAAARRLDSDAHHSVPAEELDALYDDALLLANYAWIGLRTSDTKQLPAPVDEATALACTGPFARSMADIFCVEWDNARPKDTDFKKHLEWLARTAARRKLCPAGDGIAQQAYRRPANAILGRICTCLASFREATSGLHKNRRPSKSAGALLATGLELLSEIDHLLAFIQSEPSGRPWDLLDFIAGRLMIIRMEVWFLVVLTRNLMPAGDPAPPIPDGRKIIAEVGARLDELCTSRPPKGSTGLPSADLTGFLLSVDWRCLLAGQRGGPIEFRDLHHVLAKHKPEANISRAFWLALDIVLLPGSDFEEAATFARLEGRLMALNELEARKSSVLAMALDRYLARLLDVLERSSKVRNANEAGGTTDPDEANMAALDREWATVGLVLKSAKRLRAAGLPIDTSVLMQFVTLGEKSLAHSPPDLLAMSNLLENSQTNRLKRLKASGVRLEQTWAKLVGNWHVVVLMLLKDAPHRDPTQTRGIEPILLSINNIARRTVPRRVRFNGQGLAEENASFELALRSHMAKPSGDLYHLAHWFYACGRGTHRQADLPAVLGIANALAKKNPSLMGLTKACVSVIPVPR
jgi:hypothetical protein